MAQKSAHSSVQKTFKIQLILSQSKKINVHARSTKRRLHRLIVQITVVMASV